EPAPGVLLSPVSGGGLVRRADTAARAKRHQRCPNLNPNLGRLLPCWYTHFGFPLGGSHAPPLVEGSETHRAQGALLSGYQEGKRARGTGGYRRMTTPHPPLARQGSVRVMRTRGFECSYVAASGWGGGETCPALARAAGDEERDGLAGGDVGAGAGRLLE